ncbi:hypothetical protein DID77_03375 [Candidatus Marinamargulisbacteria bacterium SCGC AG-439-L15]|nr:hypothetical protein DID77_03375 [Candidatus Marinamargulisbacteria bacterium SCGC AG-439-L15]
MAKYTRVLQSNKQSGGLKKILSNRFDSDADLEAVLQALETEIDSDTHPPVVCYSGNFESFAVFNRDVYKKTYDIEDKPYRIIEIKDDGNCGPRALLKCMYDQSVDLKVGSKYKKVDQYDYRLDRRLFSKLRTQLGENLKDMIRDQKAFWFSNQGLIGAITRFEDESGFLEETLFNNGKDSDKETRLNRWLEKRINDDGAFLSPAEVQLLALSNRINLSIFFCSFDMNAEFDVALPDVSILEGFELTAEYILTLKGASILMHNLDAKTNSHIYNHFSVMTEDSQFLSDAILQTAALSPTPGDFESDFAIAAAAGLEELLSGFLDASAAPATNSPISGGFDGESDIAAAAGLDNLLSSLNRPESN